MTSDLMLALDLAIDAALGYTVDVITALTLGGDWAKVDDSWLQLQKAGAVLEWEAEKPSRDPLCSGTAVYDDQTVALLLGGVGSWPEFGHGTVFFDRSANSR